MTDSNNIFAMVPIEILQDSRLTFRQMRVLIALFSFRNKATNLTCPSREKLGKRCGLPTTRISVVTRELVELGWLTKEGKGGFSKASRYEITVPAFLLDETVTESVTVTKPVTVTESVTNTVTDLVTNTVTDLVTRKEQTSKQTSKQTISKAVKKLTFVLPEWVNQNHWDAWHLHPKRKKLSDEQKQIALEQLDEWRQAGLDYAQALKNSAINSYQGIFLPEKQNDRRQTLRDKPSRMDISNIDYQSGVNADGSF